MFSENLTSTRSPTCAYVVFTENKAAFVSGGGRGGVVDDEEVEDEGGGVGVVDEVVDEVDEVVEDEVVEDDGDVVVPVTEIFVLDPVIVFVVPSGRVDIAL